MALKDPAVLRNTLDEEQRAMLTRLTESVRRYLGDQLDRIVLYGSRARGDAGPESDIDLLVLTRGEPSTQDRSRLSGVAAELQAETGAFLPFSIVVMSRRRFEELRAHERRFALDVEREGISL